MMYSKASTESSEDLIPVFNDSQMAIEEESGRSYVVLAEPRQKTAFGGTRCRRLYLIASTVLSVILLLVVVWLALFKHYKYRCTSQIEVGSRICSSEGCVQAAYKLMNFMDKTSDPCKDFFQFSCGGWLQKNRIPDNETSWSVDTVLLQDNLDVLRRLLEADVSPANEHSAQAEKEVRRFYRSCLNDQKRNRLSGKPLRNYMKQFPLPRGNLTLSRKELTETLDLLLQNFSLPLLFHLSVDADDKNSQKHIIKLNQAGIGLPKKKYDANNSDEVLKAYVELMTDLTVLITHEERSEVHSSMMKVFEFERSLAKIHVPMEEMTQIDEVYRKITVTELQSICPIIDWHYLFKKLFRGLVSIDADEEIVVYTLDFFKQLSAVVKKTPPSTLADFVFWKIVNSFSPYLSDDFIEARKKFTKVLLGSSGAEPRWKSCVAEADNVMGMAVGAMFVRATFPTSSKIEVAQMVLDIRKAFINHLSYLPWMDSHTQELARFKANAMKEKIGFPLKILEAKKLDKMYEGLFFSTEDYFGNYMKRNSFELTKMLKKLRKSVDRTEWLMTPSTINAYYNPSFNEIVFPAGILQAPFYSKSYSKAVNYGGIGAIIGHELLHGFDNDGRLYDKNGNFGKTWWSRKSAMSFKRRSRCFIDEYSKFVMFGKNVNGKVTLGENIADNGGLKSAYIAYKKWVQENGEQELLPGLSLTNDQAFFVSYGQSWCSHERKGKALYLLDTDTHSPAKDRVLGTVSNMPEFAKAFRCPLGTPMNPKLKCGIW